MTIDEAIKELTRYINEPYSKLHPYFSEATKLGVEAMKQLEDWRRGGVLGLDEPLLGETK